MADSNGNAWKCDVCGYVHRGDEAPDWCPVCGAAEEDFAPLSEEAGPAPDRGAERWKCLNCAYVHSGTEPPETCEVCGADADRFAPLSEDGGKAGGVADARRVVIVGAGVAGVAAAEAVRGASPAAEIVLISREPGLPYFRLNLTRYLAGEVASDELPLHPENWYEDQRIELLSGREVSSLGLEGRSVELLDGDKLSFDKLILTVGAHPFVPPIPGSQREGVRSFRTSADAEHILDAVKRGARAVCIGGGILGLETAGALARQGADVSLIEGHGWLLPRQLNQAAGEALQRYVEEAGIKLHRRARTDEILGDERVRAVSLREGDPIPADLVIITTGVRPNSYLARLAGLEVDQGLVVDDCLGTSRPDVLAAGDVAQHRGVLYGNWMASQSQGSIAGMNAAGLRVEFGGIPRSNTLKVLGVELFSIGLFEPTDASFEVIEQDQDGKYLRFVFRDSHLVGAILLGDAHLAAPVKRAVEGRSDWSALLRARPNAAQVCDHLAALGR